jgi:eukaryotic-like serine/threonine-protein kinase
MHDDPTRTMGQPEPPGEPGAGRSRGNMRLLIAGLIAVIVGLLVAIVVIASDSGGGASTSTVNVAPGYPGTVTEGKTGSTPTKTESTSTEPTTTEPTTTESTEATTTESTEAEPPPEEENGSGGIGAP